MKKLIIIVFALTNLFGYVQFPAGEADFYSAPEFFNIHVENGKRELWGFHLERSGNTQFIKRTH